MMMMMMSDIAGELECWGNGCC